MDEEVSNEDELIISEIPQDKLGRDRARPVYTVALHTSREELASGGVVDKLCSVEE